METFRNLSKKELFLLSFFILGFIVSVCSATLWSSPTRFPKDSYIVIENGETLTQVAEELQNQNIIRSPFWFKVFVVLQSGKHTIAAGDYYFKAPQGLGMISSRFVYGEFNTSLVKVTIPEGLTNVEVSKLLGAKFPLLDTKAFLDLAPQGYLFPDTYAFFPNVKAKSIVGRMEDVFNTKTADLKSEAQTQKKNFANIVVLASILEKEARPSDMKMVSGILWKRISIGMALQVDAATSTYQAKGLPLTPISNPGLVALDAALNPEKTDYLYYLSDKSGKMYYAKTFTQHQKNRELYLNK